MMFKKLIVLSLFILTLKAQDTLVLASKYYIDNDHTFTIDSIYEHKDIFIPSTLETTNIGFSDATIWLYAKVTNTSSHTVENIIQFPYPLLEYIHVLTYEDSQRVDDYLTGHLTPFDTRKVNTFDFAIPYTLEG